VEKKKKSETTGKMSSLHPDHVRHIFAGYSGKKVVEGTGEKTVDNTSDRERQVKMERPAEGEGGRHGKVQGT